LRDFEMDYNMMNPKNEKLGTYLKKSKQTFKDLSQVWHEMDNEI